MKYVALNKRSIVTGRSIAQAIEARTINRKRFKFKPSVLVRWGNSYATPNNQAIELNSRQSVSNASNKLLMAKILSSAEGVKFPKLFLTENGAFPQEVVNRCSNGEEFYFRNRFNQARRRSRVVSGDLYCLEIVDKKREFRVHVFNDKVLGVYEKIPNDPSLPYWKSDFCQFKRLDMSDDDVRKSIKGVRPMAKAATKALGMLFSGVDVIIDSNNDVYVNEVNSAPSLNSTNIERWANEIEQYIKSIEQ